MDVEAEVKGKSENTGRHLELDLLREEASAPYVHPKKRGGYYCIQDERILIGCNKRDTHHSFRFLCPEVILSEKGEHSEYGDPLSSALQRGGHQSQAKFVQQDRSKIFYSNWA